MLPIESIFDDVESSLSHSVLSHDRAFDLAYPTVASHALARNRASGEHT
jgi:hypothetical protein